MKSKLIYLPIVLKIGMLHYLMLYKTNRWIYRHFLTDSGKILDGIS